MGIRFVIAANVLCVYSGRGITLSHSFSSCLTYSCLPSENAEARRVLASKVHQVMVSNSLLLTTGSNSAIAAGMVSLFKPSIVRSASKKVDISHF